MDPSFFFAIFKRLQAATGGMLTTGGEHFDSDGSMDLAGGFSLRSSVNSPLLNPHGLFGQLGPFADTFGPGYPEKPGWHPLTNNNNNPSENPLWVLLNESLKAAPQPTVMVNVPMVGLQEWPTMPPSWNDTAWKNFNPMGGLRVIDAFGQWIMNGKTNDTPVDPPITYGSLVASMPPAFPLKGNQFIPILFVCSMASDDGRRHGDGDMNDPGPNYLPPHFWDTSQIFLANDAGNVIDPPTLDSSFECYVVAMIGNSGSSGAGAQLQGNLPIHAICNAYSFNSFLSPGVPLPSLHNLKAGDTSATYEQYWLKGRAYDVAGFRFNVDAVASGLIDKLNQGVQNNTIDLGNKSPKDWLNEGHACVKVLLTQGESGNPFPPMGGAPLTDKSDPNKDRHIAQKNLAPLNITTMGAKQIKWTDFIVAQAAEGVNELLPHHQLSPDAFRLYLAVSRRAFERYVDPKTSKGSYRGFELVREDMAKPFPEAVILRQTHPEAVLQVADHARQPFIGFSLGIEWEPERAARAHISDIAIAHAGADRRVVGGLTHRPRLIRQRPSGRGRPTRA